MCQLLERIKWLKPVFVQRRAKQPRHFYASCYLETTRVFHREVSSIEAGGRFNFSARPRNPFSTLR